jgi:hypothetical protein
MKRYLQFFVLIIGCCSIQCISFAQDGLNKEYTVKFSGYKTRLSKQASITIDSIASAMKGQPDWNYAISCGVVCNPRISAITWDRVNTIVNKLVTNYGIGAERFVISFDDNPESYNEVRLRYTDQRISTDPPPHLNLRKKVNQTPCVPAAPSTNY